MKIVFKFLIILMFFSLVSCNKKNFPSIATGSFAEMRRNASPDFREGWESGCETGAAASANNFHKMVLYNSVTVDGYKMTQSTEYKTAWNFAWWYCYRYMYIKHKSTIWGSFFGGYK